MRSSDASFVRSSPRLPSTRPPTFVSFHVPVLELRRGPPRSAGTGVALSPGPLGPRGTELEPRLNQPPGGSWGADTQYIRTYIHWVCVVLTPDKTPGVLTRQGMGPPLSMEINLSITI